MYSGPRRNVFCMHRRRVLKGAAAMSATAALLLGMSGSGVAQSEYPTKPVHIVVSFAAGGATDSTGRFFAQALS